MWGIYPGLRCFAAFSARTRSGLRIFYTALPPASNNVILYKIPPADPTRSINPDKYRISLLYPACPAQYLAAFYYHPGPLRVNPILNDISCIATLQHSLPNKRHCPPPQFIWYTMNHPNSSNLPPPLHSRTALRIIKPSRNRLPVPISGSTRN